MLGIHSVLQLLHTSNLPEDDVNITGDWLYTGVGDPGETQFAALDAALQSFLVDTPSGSVASVSEQISIVMQRSGGARVVLWEIPDAPGLMGSPVYTGPPFNTDAALTSTSFPNEVAYVQSFNADLTDVPESAANPTPPPASIRPAARRRGRMYIGPLAVATAETVGTPIRVTPTAAFRTIVRQATRQFLGLQAAAADWDFAVWSRADWACRPVVSLFDDSAFDTQRRRGEAPLSRTATAFPGV